MQQPARRLASPISFVSLPEPSEREAALLEVVSELSARYGDAVPAAIVDEVLSGSSIKLPRNADGSVTVRDYAEWHIALGEALALEMDRY